MSEGQHSKARLEACKAQIKAPAVSASVTDVQTAGALARQLAETDDSSADLRALASFYAQELAAPASAENQARREQLLAAWRAVASRFGGF